MVECQQWVNLGEVYMEVCGSIPNFKYFQTKILKNTRDAQADLTVDPRSAQEACDFRGMMWEVLSPQTGESDGFPSPQPKQTRI